MLEVDEPMIRGMLININTGRYMGSFPVGLSIHSGQVHGSTYAAWTTVGYRLVLIHFPDQ